MKITRTLGLLAALAALAVLEGIAPSSATAQTGVDSAVTNGLFEPFGVAADNDGLFYFTDSANHRIAKVLPGANTATTLAGLTGVSGTNSGVGNLALFNQPQGIVLARGGLVVADSANHTIRFVSFSGAVSNLAGTPGVFGLSNGPAGTARFRFPSGLSADAAGNIYIADSFNNAVRKLDVNNNVTTLVSGLFQPGAVAAGTNGELWIADTRRHCIKRLDTNGVLTVVAGVSGTAGSSDSLAATNSLFSNPRGLLFVGGPSGLLVSDSGNHTVRRLFFNTNVAMYSTELYAGTPEESGVANGPALSASFNTPIGLARDLFNSAFLVVDKANNQIRRISTGIIQPPVNEPIIGFLVIIDHELVLQPVISSTFNNEITIAMQRELGTDVHYTYGATSPDPLVDNVPNPGVNDTSPPDFRNGLVPAPIEVSENVKGDFTIKAIGMQTGRRSSDIVSARFQFRVGNPSILGENAASFRVSSVTTNAEMWYTWDGSDPTNNPAVNTNVNGPVISGDNISFNIGTSNRTFKIRSFRAGYRPSDVATKVFTPENFDANKISFGFESGEGSSVFMASAGQRFYAPVTLGLLPQQTMYSLQFNVVVTNRNAVPVDGAAAGFRTALEYIVPIDGDQVGPDGVDYDLIHPQMVGGFDNFGFPILTNLLFTNASINLLGVGYIARRGYFDLFPTEKQDLITHSQPHDTVFLSSAGKVVVGSYSFVVPGSATNGSTYELQLGRVSATSDGVSKNMFIDIPTNGSLFAGAVNGKKLVTVATQRYVVGDAAPFRWFNAGDFGDTNLLNNDVLQVYQSAILRINTPPEGSDLLDSMDSSDGVSNATFDGSNYAIDNIQFGDGGLNVDDVFVTFRRSLDPSLKWHARYWEGGLRRAVQVPNGASGGGAGGGAAPAAPPPPPPLTPPTGIPSVVVSADDVVGTAGSVVQVPVRVHITGGLPIRVAGVSVIVEPLDGSPELTAPIDFVPSGAIGSPAMQTASGFSGLSAAWLDNTVAGVSGDAVLLTVTVPIPAGAGPFSAYRLRFKHFSASPNGLGLFRSHVHDGMIALSDRSGSSWGDGISDLWRLRWFGNVTDLRSAANVDADGDGRSNLAEYQTGTNPLNRRSVLAIATRPFAGGVALSFPTGSGRSYILECASQLGGTWTPLSTNAGDGGLRELTDTPSGSGHRFYRIRTQ